MPLSPDHHLFLSYARKDNTPKGAAQTGWVTAFHDHLRLTHQHYSGRPLNIFFDQTSIPSDSYWQTKILSGLKTSRLFLAFLSPNYIASKYCRWEWEEYLRLEHTLARGEAGIKQVYFVKVPELEGETADDDMLETWLEDLRARNRDHSIDLRNWFEAGPDELLRLDASARLADLQEPQTQALQTQAPLSLPERIVLLDRSISERLDEAVLAELAPGKIERKYDGFVGRSQELRDLHKGLMSDRVGLIGALHGLGGQGKTALAVQYAYAYAAFYACGGRWQVPCEGKQSLREVLEDLSQRISIPIPETLLRETGKQADAKVIKQVLALLKKQTWMGKDNVLAAFEQRSDRHTSGFDKDRLTPRMLIVFDNVDQPDLLSAEALAPLTNEDWLEIVVTTRLDPQSLGDTRSLDAISVDDLPEADAMALLRNWRSFETEDEEQAARKIVSHIGGFTLAVELIGAYLHFKPSVGYRAYHQRLKDEGALGVDALKDSVRHVLRSDERRQTIGAVTNVMLEELQDRGPVTRKMFLTTLELASFMPPDQIRTDWLRLAVAQFHPELTKENVKPGYADPWEDDLLPTLEGRRLLTTAPDSRPHHPLGKLHRMVGEHLQSQTIGDQREALLACLAKLNNHLGTWLEQAAPSSPQLRVHGPDLLALTQSLLKFLPDSLDLVPQLGVCADLELQHGNFYRAGVIFRERHSHSLRILDANPDSAQAARDLSLSQERLGSFHLQRGQAGDIETALDYFNKSLKTLQRILDANPDSAQAARDLSVSQERLGSFHLQRGQAGDIETALDYFNKSLKTLQRILDANPDSAQAARDLSVSQERLGSFHLQRGQAGDIETALDYFN
ncbi:TIR domain-containing protein, partial [Roseibium alexandrii]